MSQQWRYSRDGGATVAGPVSSGELKRLADARQLSPTDLVWADGTDKQVPAGRVKGLFPADQPAATAKPVPVAVPPSGTATPPQPTVPVPANTDKPASNGSIGGSSQAAVTTTVAIPVAAPPATQVAPPSDRQVLLDQLAVTFREVVEGVRSVPDLAAAVFDLDHIDSRVTGTGSLSDELQRQVREIDDRSRRHGDLTRRRAETQTAVAAAEKKLLEYAAEVGSAVLKGLNSGQYIGVTFDPATSTLLDGCGGADRHLTDLRAKSDELGRVTGMVAKLKAKAEQAVLWGRIKRDEGVLAAKTTQLGQQVLTSGSEQQFRSPATVGVLGRLAATRAEVVKQQGGVRAVDADLQHPDLAEAAGFTARRAECQRLLDGQEAVRLNGYAYLARRCRVAAQGTSLGDGLMAPVAQLEAGLSSLARLDDERQISGLPAWLAYKYDQIEQQHVWTAAVVDSKPVGFGLRRVKKGDTDRTFLVVVYRSTGGGLKVGHIPGAVRV